MAVSLAKLSICQRKTPDLFSMGTVRPSGVERCMSSGVPVYEHGAICQPWRKTPDQAQKLKRALESTFPKPAFCGIVKYKFGRRLGRTEHEKLTIQMKLWKSRRVQTTVSLPPLRKANKMSEETQQWIWQIIDETVYLEAGFVFMKAKSSGLATVI